MPRRNRAHRQETPLRGGYAAVHTETHPDGEWIVRQISAAQATKDYRCPGCDHEIRCGVAHIVAWPAEEHGSVADRRHWHASCWSARDRRGPTRRWW